MALENIVDGQSKTISGILHFGMKMLENFQKFVKKKKNVIISLFGCKFWNYGHIVQIVKDSLKMYVMKKT